MSDHTTPAADRDGPDSVQVLRVRVGDHVHAIESGHLAGVVDRPAETPVPRTGDAVAGVARLRDEVTVLVDTHAVLGVASDSGSVQAAIVERGPTERPLALLVDGTVDMERVPVDRFLPVAETDLDDRVFAAGIPTDGGHTGVFGVERLADLVRAAGD